MFPDDCAKERSTRISLFGVRLAPAFPNEPYIGDTGEREREKQTGPAVSPFCLFHHLPSGGVTSRRRPAANYTSDWVVSAVSPDETSTRLPKNTKKRNQIKGIAHFQASFRPGCQPTRKKNKKRTVVYTCLPWRISCTTPVINLRKLSSIAQQRIIITEPV